MGQSGEQRMAWMGWDGMDDTLSILSIPCLSFQVSTSPGTPFETWIHGSYPGTQNLGRYSRLISPMPRRDRTLGSWVDWQWQWQGRQ